MFLLLLFYCSFYSFLEIRILSYNFHQNGWYEILMSRDNFIADILFNDG